MKGLFARWEYVRAMDLCPIPMRPLSMVWSFFHFARYFPGNGAGSPPIAPVSLYISCSRTSSVTRSSDGSWSGFAIAWRAAHTGALEFAADILGQYAWYSGLWWLWWWWWWW